MLFKSLLNPNKSIIWTLFHIGLGFISTISPYPLFIWFYLILVLNIIKSFSDLKFNSFYLLVSLISYLISFEMLVRMSKIAPLIPTELGKYILISISGLGILLKGIRNPIGLFMAFLLSIGLFYDLSNQREFFDLIYNYFGPLSIALGLSFFYKARITEHQLTQILHLIWFTSVSALIFTFIKTPDLDNIDFNLKAEFATTADTSSNQVATILGLGMFLSFYSIINKLKFSGNYFMDIGFMLLFAFQGLLSFSRGGIVVGVIGMLILFLFRNKRNVRTRRVGVFAQVMIAAVGLFVIFKVINNITDGNLLLRYQGETKGTLLGSKEKTNDVLLSGRLTIMQEDINLWNEHLLLGVGAGSSRYLRINSYLVSPHVELTRLLAEHGIFGLIYFILLLFIFWKAYKNISPHINKGIFLSLFCIALFTTFHAALRTYLSPLFFIIASLLIIPDEKKRYKSIKNTSSWSPEHGFKS